jgi:hypothetical protein
VIWAVPTVIGVGIIAWYLRGMPKRQRVAASS